MSLPFWAVREQDLGGHIFSSRSKYVPPAQWRFSALWDGCLLCYYEGDEVPFGPVVVTNKDQTPIGSSVIKKGQLVRIWPSYIANGVNGITFGLKMKHAYRRGTDTTKVPTLYAFYKMRCGIEYCKEKGVYELKFLYINDEKFPVCKEDLTMNTNYFVELMETVVNELIYLDQDIPSIPERIALQVEKERFYNSVYRYENFHFFMSHMEYALRLQAEEKEIERQRHIHLGTIPNGPRTGLTSRVVREQKEPQYPRTDFPVIGDITKDEITSDTCKIPGCGFIVNNMWFIVDWPTEKNHAFWVCYLKDKEHFLVGNVYHRENADADHPFWKFYHTKESYAKLRKLCNF